MSSHLSADLLDIPEAILRDLPLLRATLVAAAGAVGLGPVAMPSVHEGAHAIALTLVSDGRHIVVQSFPATGVLLLDVLAPAVQDSQRALDVFTRRLTPRDVRSETRERPPRHHRPRG